MITDYVEQVQPWHTHENPTFFVHLRGSHLDTLPSTTFEQPVLTVVYHPAGLQHRSHVGPLGMTGLNIELTPEWLEENELTPLAFGSERLIDGLREFCATMRLIDAVVHSTVPKERENLLLDFVALITNDVKSLAEPQWFEEVLRRANDLSSPRQSVREIADEVGVHPVHLARVFQRLTGESLCGRLQRMRLRLAVSLMLSGMTAGEAALEAGFGDQFYMSRCFQREFGFSPRHLKSLHRVICA